MMSEKELEEQLRKAREKKDQKSPREMEETRQRLLENLKKNPRLQKGKGKKEPPKEE